MKTYQLTENKPDSLCEPLAAYSRNCRMESLFSNNDVMTAPSDIRVIELFAGVGGFRIGLERASARYKTVWSNQWEPSTKRQDASTIYCRHFGVEGHSNKDINLVDIADIPAADMLVAGFPCQDYSVATTLKNSGGIEGKKGVLWWQIHRILSQHPTPPPYLMLENVDRLLGSPASQRGRDFAIILASLSDLGYIVEWRVINAADYGMPQRRRRTYMFAYKNNTPMASISAPETLVTRGIMSKAFPIDEPETTPSSFKISGNLKEISDSFNIGKSTSPFKNAGVIFGRNVFTLAVTPHYNGSHVTLGDVLQEDSEIPPEFIISVDDLPKWQYSKGSKSEKRVDKTTGFEYNYSEGAMAFPDQTNRPSRTIITGEGGAAPSRFKHVVMMSDGRYRRLTPLELERLNMFPDHHTDGASNMRRAFLMGNALVTGIVERIGLQALKYIKK